MHGQGLAPHATHDGSGKAMIDLLTAAAIMLPQDRSLPVSRSNVARYSLSPRELRQIEKSKRWASGQKARSVVACESGGRYHINTGNGYYGAWQFNYSTWLGNGGGKYARYAHLAPKWAQDHIAYRTWKSRGWQPWACA